MSERWKIGEIIKDRYEIRYIKRGGMGIVFLCYDNRDRTGIAIKTFQDKYLLSEDAIGRFKWEAETWVRLEKHKNIVQAYYVDLISDRPYIFLELVPGDKNYGSDLTGWIWQNGLDLNTTLSFAIQFCLGMEHADKKFKVMGKSFVHRDIKPGNIMVTQDKVVKITDFGLAKTFLGCQGDLNIGNIRDEETGAERAGLSIAGTRCGTPPYMSPEQFRGEVELDTRSDIYALGCVLYEMLTGMPPFKCPTPMYINYHLNVNPRPLVELVSSIPEEISTLVMRCLEKEPAKRYQDFISLREELSEIYFQRTGDRVKIESISEELQEGELVNKGLSLKNLGKYEEAIVCFNKVLEINPRYADAWDAKGGALDILGKYEEGIGCHNKALEINPKYVEAWLNKGLALDKLGKIEEAIGCFNKALEINPRYADAWDTKGLALGRLGKTEEAIVCFNKALEINPKYADAWLNKGVALDKLGKYEEAIGCFNKALEINPRYSEAWYNKGSSLGNLGKYEEAIGCFNKTLEINPNFAEAWYNKGFSLGNLGKYEEAIAYFNKALGINLRYAEAWLNKGFSLGNLGKYEEAIACFNKALEINPKDAEALYNKGVALDNLGKYEVAIGCFNTTLEINPNLAEAWLNKGFSLGNLGKYEEAIGCFNMALEINPKDAEAWYNKGLAFGNLGKYEEAIKAFQSFINLVSPQYAELLPKAKEFIQQFEAELKHGL
jgi:tetratricopeptide (TPR) repeat protein